MIIIAFRTDTVTDVTASKFISVLFVFFFQPKLEKGILILTTYILDF